MATAKKKKGGADKQVRNKRKKEAKGNNLSLYVRDKISAEQYFKNSGQSLHKG